MPAVDTATARQIRPPKAKRKPVYGPPAPKPKAKVIYGPPAPKPKAKPKVIYGPPSPRQIAGPPAPKPKPAAPRRPTPAEVAASRARTQRAVRTERQMAPRLPENSIAAIERFKSTPAYRKVLDEAHAKRIDDSRSGVSKFLHNLGRTSTSDRLERENRAQGRGGPLGTVTARAAGMLPLSAAMQHLPGPLGQIHRNLVKDVAENVASTPTSVAKLAETAVTHPKKVPGMLAAPYIAVAKHPVKEFTERPFSTGSLVLPAGRLPGRAIGRVARATGKQTLQREAATLPGTALKEQRTGSRDVAVRHAQKRRDRKRGTPTVSRTEVQRRVDEFYDFRKHKIAQAVDAAAREAKGHGMTHEQAQAHIETARVAADHAMQAHFAREFGANQRPSIGAAEKKASKATRKQTEAQHTQAKASASAAHADVEAALAEARAARGGGSAQLSALEASRAQTLRGLYDERLAKTRAQLEHARAHGAARVSEVRSKASPRLRELHAERKRITGRAVTATVVAARSQVRSADRAVAALERTMAREQERASRLEGVTEGRTAAGKMTGRAGKAAADQAERIGMLNDELTRTRRASATARENLKAVESHAKGTVKAQVRAVDDAIGAEHRRISGVAPKEAGRMHAAIGTLEDVGARVRGGRASVREIERQISAERLRTAGVPHPQMNRLVNALARRDEARTAVGEARAAEQVAKAAHVDVKRQVANAPLVAAKDQGRVFADKADASKVAQRLNEAGHEIPAGGKVPARFVESEGGMQQTRMTKNVTEPHEFKVVKVGENRFAVMPKVAAERLHKHQVVGTGKSTGAKLLRTSRGAFTNATLPLSMKWLFGQASEAGIRSAISGAGPMDFLRMKRVVKQMNARHPGSGDEMMTRLSGGQFGLTGAAREFADGKSLADEFKGTGLEQPARAVTRAGQTMPARIVRAGWSKYTKAVLGSINGVFESTARTAMAGQALKNSPFLEKHVIGLTERAIDDAAKGLKGTEAQVDLARQVDRMYGQYQKFSPGMRETLLHWTPFLPWYLNTVKFLFHHLPADHPMTHSLLVSANLATEEWRKQHNLSQYADSKAPDFLQGSFPIFGDRLSRLGQFSPWGIGSDPASAVGSLALPQLAPPLFGNLAFGVDWTGKPLKHGDTGEKFTPGEKFTKAIESGLESQLPGLAQAGRISGLTQRYIDKKDMSQVPGLRERLLKELPLYPAAADDSSGSSGGVKIKPVSVKPVKIKPVKVKPVKIR